MMRVEEAAPRGLYSDRPRGSSIERDVRACQNALHAGEGSGDRSSERRVQVATNLGGGARKIDLDAVAL